VDSGKGGNALIYFCGQAAEKFKGHLEVLYILFLDLRKAYDSVPRDALWLVLEKCEVLRGCL